MGLFKGFWKILGNIGKRIYYNRETKVSLYLYGAMHHTMIEALAEAHQDNYEEAIDTLIELVKPMSEEVVSSMLFETSVMGMSLQNLIKKFRDLKDFPFFIDMTLFSVFGKWAKKIFSQVKYIPSAQAEQGVDTFVLIMKSCPFCYPTMVPPEKLGKHRFGKVLTLTIEQMTQLALDFLDHEYQVIAREVRCFHRGDTHGEIRIWLYPRDQLALIQENEYLQRIK
ncbi:MAG: hypothetical protein ACTSQI_13595 [Candidatus Helarchaeota archaeon]